MSFVLLHGLGWYKKSGRSQEQLSMRRWKDLQFYCCFLGKNDGIEKGACVNLIAMARQTLTPNLLILFVILSV